MERSSLPPEKVSTLIDQLLKAKDPATVGLKKIIRKKTEENERFPLHTPAIEEFDLSGKKTKIFNQEEKRILELEKTVADLRIEIRNEQEKAKKGIQNAFLKGKNEGFAEGLEKGRKETTELYEKKIDDIQEHLGTVFRDIEDSRKEIINNSEHVLLRICTEMVKKILSLEVSTGKDIILAVLKKALSYTGDRERMVIRVSPDDMEIVSGRKDFWAPVAERMKNITIEPDERITSGGCIVESNTGIVDARLGVQFEEIEGLIEKTWQDVHSAQYEGSDTDEVKE